MTGSELSRLVKLALQNVYLKLSEGDIDSVTNSAHVYLGLLGAPGSVLVRELATLADLLSQPSVMVGPCIDDDPVTSTARVGKGLVQHAGWAQVYQPPALRLFRLESCEVVHPSILMTAEGKVVDDNIGYKNSELCAHAPPEFPGIASSKTHIVLAERHRDVVSIDSSVIYLPVADNYAAWLFGGLPRLAAFSRCPELSRLPIVLHGEVKSYHFSSLSALGVASERLLIHGANVRLKCRQLHYCSTSYLHHAPSLTGIRYVRDRVARALSDFTGPKRLYLARRKVTDRSILNEDHVVSLFERHGFTAIDPEEHSFQTQASLAASAEIIAGPYGANLANLIFAERARKCLILATKPQPEFARLSSAVGIASWHLVPDAVKLREGRTFSESYGFVVNLELTRVMLEVCLSSDV
jgi:hypothetical protein